MLEELTQKGNLVVAVDVRGTGETNLPLRLTRESRKRCARVWLLSYRTLTSADRYLHGASIFIRSVLKHFDLPQVAAAVADRRLTILDPVDAMKSAVDLETARRAYEPAEQAYARATRFCGRPTPRRSHAGRRVPGTAPGLGPLLTELGLFVAAIVICLRVPICEGFRLMPPRWFLRFWIGQAGLG